jgi:MYXO-CTERM domain-containing protein
MTRDDGHGDVVHLTSTRERRLRVRMRSLIGMISIWLASGCGGDAPTNLGASQVQCSCQKVVCSGTGQSGCIPGIETTTGKACADDPKEADQACKNLCSNKGLEFAGSQLLLQRCTLGSSIRAVASRRGIAAGSFVALAGFEPNVTEVVLDPDRSFAFIQGPDGGSPNLPVSGTVRFTGGQCVGSEVCPIAINWVEISVPPFNLPVEDDSVHVSQVHVINNGDSVADKGVSVPNGFSLLGDLVLVANGNIEDAHGSAQFFPAQPVDGLYDPQSGFLVLRGTFLEAGGSRSLEFLLRGGSIRRPPVANAGPDQQVECQSPQGTLVTLDGSASFDFDSNILHHLWFLGNVGGSVLGNNAVQTTTLGLGAHTVTLHLIDTTQMEDSDQAVITVADSLPPAIAPSSATVVVACNETGEASLPVPTASDACSAAGSIQPTGQVIESNGQAVSVPLVEGRAVLPPGVHKVKWTATDAQGLSSSLEQLFTVESCWPMFKRTQQRRSASPFVGPQTNARLFVFDQSRLDLRSSPAVATNGTIFFGSDDNQVYAVRPDGTLKWRTQTGGDVHSSPAIGFGGTVFVGSDDDRLYALDPETGAVRCSRNLGNLDVESSPAVGGDGTVYVGSDDNRLYALDPGDCTVKWTVQTGGDVASSPAVGGDGTIYVGSNDNKLYAVRPTGSLKWTFTTGGNVESSPAISANGQTVFVGSHDRRLYALDAQSGALIWSANLGSIVRGSPVLGADGTIYVGADDDLFALRPADGSVLWSRRPGGDVNAAPAIDAAGTVYVGSTSGKVFALDGQTGNEIWSFATGAPVRSSPAIGINGALYVGSDDDKLYAFGAGLALRTIPTPVADPQPSPAAPGGCACSLSQESSRQARGGIWLLVGLTVAALRRRRRTRREPPSASRAR